MFDVGFWELCMVGLISLLVIGPERLPKAARIAGFWLGKSQRMINSVKQEIKQELREEELRQLIKEQAAIKELKELKQDIHSMSENLQSSTKQLAETAKKTSQIDEGN